MPAHFEQHIKANPPVGMQNHFDRYISAKKVKDGRGAWMIGRRESWTSLDSVDSLWIHSFCFPSISWRFIKMWRRAPVQQRFIAAKLSNEIQLSFKLTSQHLRRFLAFPWILSISTWRLFREGWRSRRMNLAQRLELDYSFKIKQFALSSPLWFTRTELIPLLHRRSYRKLESSTNPPSHQENAGSCSLK